MLFTDREDAARQLAAALKSYQGTHALVLAIPRGAVPMGRVLAQQLQADLDVVLVHKLGAPGNPELAIGAVDETGWHYVADYAATTGADQAYIEREIQRQLEIMRARRALYTPVRASIDPKDRDVIIVDDGLATGATMIAALHATRTKQPRKLVCAVPVAAPDTLPRIRPLVDELICLHAPAWFHSVGQFYARFSQVEDSEVVRLLGAEAKSEHGVQRGA